MKSMSNRTHESTGACAIYMAVLLALTTLASAAPPATVTIQAKLEAAGGAPLTGSRAYVIQLFDAETGGAQLGTDISGNAAFSATGRTAIILPWPAAAESAGEVWYRLGVDSDAVPSGVQADEFFPDRIEVTSVPFARRAADSDAVGGTSAAALSTDAERDAAIATEVSDRDAAIAAAVAAAVAALVPSPAVPAAPTELRLLPSLRGGPYRKLIWNISGFGGMANFIVYESSSPITDGNKGSAFQRFVSTTELELPIFSNAGMRYFRVAALNFAGDEGPLSDEYGLDTTSRIAYIADQENDDIFELFVAPADGSGTPVKVNPPLLTVSDVSFYGFSPDGSLLAYVADQDTDEIRELYVAPASGGGSTIKINAPLLTSGDVGSFLFSPDGSMILYRADQETDGVFEFYIAPSDGSATPVKINAPMAADQDVNSARFSADGTLIAYDVFDSVGAVLFPALFVTSAAGGGAVTQINPPPVGTVGVIQFAFSPDGSRIAYFSEQETVGVFELYVGPADGSAAAVKVNPPLIAGGTVSNTFPFSPDGSRLVYRSDQETDGTSELYVAPVAGGGTTVKINPPLVAGGDVNSFTFSADGTRIAYTADQDTDGFAELYVISAGGGSSVKINPTTPVAGGNIFGGFKFSPDGSRILYRGDPDTNNVFELYVAPTDGSGTAIKINSTIVSGGGVGSFAFSADGSHVAYRAVQDIGGVSELYVSPADGGALVKVHPPLVAGGNVNSFLLSQLGFVR